MKRILGGCLELVSCGMDESGLVSNSRFPVDRLVKECLDLVVDGCCALVNEDEKTAGQHLVFIPEMAPSASACVYSRITYGMITFMKKGMSQCSIYWSCQIDQDEFPTRYHPTTGG